MRPPYITATWSAISETTARSWLTYTSAAWALDLRWRMIVSTSRCTFTSRLVVGSSRTTSVGIDGEGHRQQDALDLPAAELVGVAAQKRPIGRQGHPRQVLGDPLVGALALPAVGGEHLAHLPADAHRGVERVSRVLADVGRLRPAQAPAGGDGQREDVGAADDDLARHHLRAGAGMAEQSHRHGRLAAA